MSDTRGGELSLLVLSCDFQGKSQDDVKLVKSGHFSSI